MLPALLILSQVLRQLDFFLLGVFLLFCLKLLAHEFSDHVRISAFIFLKIKLVIVEKKLKCCFCITPCLKKQINKTVLGVLFLTHLATSN